MTSTTQHVSVVGSPPWRGIRLTGVAAAIVILAACASTPENIEALEQARSEMAQLEQDPLAQQAASQELSRARASLRAAEEALEEGESEEKIQHLSYLARTDAQVVKATVAERRARDRIAKAEAERNQVLLESRERELAAATAEAQTARSELTQLRDELSTLQAKETDRGMVLTLGDVLFDTGQSVLKPGADLTMNRLAEFLQAHPDVQIMVEGHTDSSGSSQFNEQLSNNRAAAVANALEDRGIPRTRMHVRGRGEHYPVASNDTSAGRQQNRRVEIVFSDVKGQFDDRAATSSSR